MSEVFQLLHVRSLSIATSAKTDCCCLPKATNIKSPLLSSWHFHDPSLCLNLQFLKLVSPSHLHVSVSSLLPSMVGDVWFFLGLILLRSSFILPTISLNVYPSIDLLYYLLFYFFLVLLFVDADVTNPLDKYLKQ